ncbi:glycoside hydrolase family 5 protein [Streptomyces netropsis]|uniref:glycoside hydrolase family 5 protein n=1 Tax=Streptomyces netropsis TaxID=55404 RepID=UPI00379D6FEE
MVSLPARRLGHLFGRPATAAAVGLVLLATGAYPAIAGPGVPPARAAQAAPAAQAVPADGTALAASWAGPLSTRGRYVVDADGNRFRLRSGNWHGASGTYNGSGDINDPANHHAGEKADQMPLGLDRAPLSRILGGFHELGLNSIRLPFSNEMIKDTRPVSDASVAANPRLRGKTPLQVYDAVIQELTDQGFAVILNNHTSSSKWCCGLDENAMWNSNQTTAAWEADWIAMAKRYKGNSRVVGADLYNEVRPHNIDFPNWGENGGGQDWFSAAQRAGDRILTEANPDLLIIIEGINWRGVPGLGGHRPHLQPARTLSHTLVVSDKLVYSAHFYGYTGSKHTGASGGLGATSDPRYQDLSPTELKATLNREAFFVSQENGRHYTHPLWISEFGVGGRTETDQKSKGWFRNFVQYLIDTDADYAYWPLMGWTESNNGWAALEWDKNGNRRSILDDNGTADWRAEHWKRLAASPGHTGQVTRTDTYSMLDLDHDDHIASRRMRAAGDWDNGYRKAACPDGQRLIGLSRAGTGGYGRGLCTDAGGRSLWQPGAPHTIVTSEPSPLPSGDWASGQTKVQCPNNYMMIGYSTDRSWIHAALCAKADTVKGTTSRTLWFDSDDNRPSDNPGGEFANGNHKAQCRADEYLAGFAYTGLIKKPNAVLCRTLN